MKNNYPELEAKLKKTIDNLASELATIRAGRANAAVLDKVTVEYYGTATPINQIASISSPEPRVLVISPWDGSVLKAVEKAIIKSDVGITPISDGKTVRLNFPPLNEERRRELTKTVKKYCEEAKIAVRNGRKETLDKYKAMKKKSEITEDDMKNVEKDLIDIVDRYVKEVDKVGAAKEKEIMEV